MEAVELGPRGATTLEELLEHARLSDAARALIPVVSSADEYVSRLAQEGLYSDGVRVLAQGLRVRQSVWWLCLATWRARGDQLPSDADRFLEVAAHWVIAPSETHRRAAQTLASGSKLKGASTCCVRAVSLAGAASAPGAELVGGQAPVVGKLVAAGLNAASIAPAGPPIPKKEFFELGLEVAAGKHGWDVARAPE